MSAIAGWPGPAQWTERMAAPVIADLGASDAHRDAHLACWTWTFRKLRWTNLRGVDLDLHMPGRRVDAAALVWTEEGLRYFMSDLTSAPSAEPASRVVCADLSRSRIDPGQAFTATLAATYSSWPWLWSTTYDMAPATFPAIDTVDK